VRFEFIQAEKARYPVATLCRVLGVARSGLYAAQQRDESPRAREDRALLVHIREAHVESRRTYGSPRVHLELRDRGFQVGRNRIARLMRLDGIVARHRRRFVRTTVTDPGLPVAPNTLARHFSPTQANAVWAADITYIRTLQGWLYLAVVLDLFSRRVVGWAAGARMDRELVLSALSMAIGRRAPAPGLLHHSDQGCQYQSWDYQRTMQKLGIACSMSRKGNCWDNAVVESFFSTLKTELVYRTSFGTREQGRSELFDYIETFYNTKRRHSALGYVSPADFERLRATRRVAS
jgi:transposase InsO family protein